MGEDNYTITSLITQRSLKRIEVSCYFQHEIMYAYVKMWHAVLTVMNIACIMIILNSLYQSPAFNIH